MRSTSRSIVLAAEVGLAVVTLAAVVGMARLFQGGGWLGPLALNAIAAHLTAAVLRRRGLSLPVTAAAMVVGAVVMIGWTCYLSTTVVGIPTGETWSTVGDDLSAAWALYKDVVAPAPAEPGFIVSSAAAVWAIAYIADWAAFRLWVPFEATLPADTLFLFTSLLGAPRGRAWAVGAYAIAVLGFLLLHTVARQDGTSHWVADRRTGGQRSLLTAGTALGALAVVVGTVIGPALPGADSPGVLDPRSLRESDSGRQTISPLVDIRTRLVDQSNVEVFQVRASAAEYWRLTSLERFDGRIWSSEGSFGSADGALPSSVEADVATETISQTFTIKALAAIWLPAAYEPASLSGEDLQVRYDEESATLIVDNEIPSSDGLVYEVTSASPRLTPDDLAGTAAAVPDDIRADYLPLPDGFSDRVRSLAGDITAGATSPAEQARMLQDHLRTFEYSLDVGAGHGGNALEQFLFETQTGYCEQFAGAYAAMARAVGLPARVAVGFTQGERDETDPTLFHVRGEHAHAWPEVYLAGAGWVPFEPTPGRGMPGAEAHTGVTPAQAASGNPGTATTAPSTTVAPAGSPGGGPVTTPRNPDAQLDTVGGAPDDTAVADVSESILSRYLWRPLRILVPAALVAGLLYLVVVPATLWTKRRLRRRRATTPAERIHAAWTAAVEDAVVVGFLERASDTYQERSAALARLLPAAAEHVALLADRLEVSAYSSHGADDDEAEEAEEAARAVGAGARAAAPLTARVRRWLDARPLLGAWRSRHRVAHRRITTTVRADLESERGLVS